MKKIIVAQDVQSVMTKAMVFLQRSKITVLTAATHDEMLKLHIKENCHLLVTKIDTPGLECETLIRTIRASDHTRDISIIVLYNDTVEHRDRIGRCGANAVFPLPIATFIFVAKVQEFLNSAARRPYGVVMSMTVEGKHKNRPFLANLENLSSSGILVKTTEQIARGEQVVCSFYLPDGEHISSAGEIVWVVPPEPSSDVSRYGIRFTSLTNKEEAILASFVEKNIYQQIDKSALARFRENQSSSKNLRK